MADPQLGLDFSYYPPYTPTDLRAPGASQRTTKRKRRAAERGEDGPTPAGKRDGTGVSSLESDLDALSLTTHYQGGTRFPHRGSDHNAKPLTPKQIRNELSRLNPPLQLPLRYGPDRRAPSMRQRNVGVLVAIMHRSLLEGDWVRAGRAWGLLVHTRFEGRHLDIRKDGLYGIGAEILLRRGAASRDPNELHGPPEDGASRCAFSKEGLDAARTYYDRLALQFPYRKPRSKEADAIDFHLVKFGLWISAVQDMHDMEDDGSQGSGVDSDSNDSDQFESSGSERPWRRGRRRLKETIHAAEQIDQRLNEVLQPPLPADFDPLLRLQADVRAWIDDLKRH